MVLIISRNTISLKINKSSLNAFIPLIVFKAFWEAYKSLSIVLYFQFIMESIKKSFEVYDLLSEDDKTTINEIILNTVSKNFDIDINDFDYEIKGTII